ncbi:MAG: DUF4184 family protein [Steroidobacteraceae bacterium]
MPFTVSHVAVILPVQRVLRRWQLLSAAVIGTMVPDFGLVLPLSLDRSQTHGFSALFSFCLPVGLLAWWLFQLLIKPAVVEIMPDRWYLRLTRQHPPLSIMSLRNWFAGMLAILLGAISHLVLDGFTHEHGRGTLLIPGLDNYMVSVAGHPMLLYHLLQYLFSIVGLLLVLWALGRWVRATPRFTGQLQRHLAPGERRRWALGYLILPLLVLLLTGMRELRVAQMFGPQIFLSSRSVAHLLIQCMEATSASLIIVSALIRMRLSEYDDEQSRS